jgi:enoyl-CoA hydratase/carnithine racemase
LSESEDEELVTLSVDDHVATLTLNDPARRNCVSARMSKDVAAACARLADNPDVHAVVVTGAGPVFSAGGDVDSLTRRDNPLEVAYRGFAGIAAIEVPVVCAVNGPAVGAGLNFALACDVIVAARSAYFEARFLDIGIHPGGGYLWAVRHAAGAQAAAAMALFGERISADRAEQLGLVWRSVDDDHLAEYVHGLATRAARPSSELSRRTKTTLRTSAAITRRQVAVDVEQVAQHWSMDRPAFAEGVAALRRRLARTPANGDRIGRP